MSKKESNTVLIADDDPLLIDMYRAAFKRLKLNVCIVKSGNDVLEKVKTEKPGVILMDVRLPGLSGIEILKKMRNTPSMKDIPVIVISNLAPEDANENYDDLGILDYLVKSKTNLFDLSDRVQKLLQAGSA